MGKMTLIKYLQRFMGILMVFGRFGRQKTKPNKANIPAFGRKSEVRISKYETSWKDTFEKTKPILVSPQTCTGGWNARFGWQQRSL